MQGEKQREAYINEWKGTLFEFLVASHIATHSHCLESLYREIPAILLEQLNFYQNELRKVDQNLYLKLPLMAKSVANKLINKMQLNNVLSIKLIGRPSVCKASGFAEADLLITDAHRCIPISLKLSKSQSFVNTKSGGIHSFINKYFSCTDNEVEQHKLSMAVRESFEEMKQELLDSVGASLALDFNQTWTNLGLSFLPGELPVELASIVHSHYHRVIKFVHQFFMRYQGICSESLGYDLLQLCGFSAKNLTQVICFHKSVELPYESCDTLIKDHTDLVKEIKHFRIRDLNPRLASFEVELPSVILQVRVKPMNKFNVEGLKVNNSIKWKDVSLVRPVDTETPCF